MSLNSLQFLLFVLIGVAGYYLVPKRIQWIWLLIFSYIYYLSNGPKMVIYLIVTTTSTYLAGRYLEVIQDQKRRKAMVTGTLLLNFGILACLKYFNFFAYNIAHIFHGTFTFVDFALPIGISFYTFQSMGYLLDVYWKKGEAEKNYFRFALFVSFFPQILQGPIGRYSRLGHQLYEEHTWNGSQIEEGCQRILWGFFKKIVLADTAAPFVNALFDQYTEYSGVAIFAVLAYSIQLYGDFSGGVDIVVGIGKLFGITMDENFKRPFFARSITDFWHRWHITLGTWMKDYVFYPISLSRWMNKFGKMAKKKFGRAKGRVLPICLANLIVFLVVGVWHGAAWKFIAYGLYNGAIIAFSGLMAGTYRKWKKTCHIQEKSWYFQGFQILRTFLLVNISWFFDRGDTIPQAFAMMKNSVTRWEPSQLLQVPIGMGETTRFTVLALGILLFGVLVVFLFGLLEERGISPLEKLRQCPVWVRIMVYVFVIFLFPLLGQPPVLTGGFIYAQF